jgi:hypothetical protein
MRTVRTKVYKFNELNEDAKQKAISHFQNINVGFDWWNSVYEDAENIGLKITSFDLDRNRHAKGKFLIHSDEVARKIISEHGEHCETHKTAKTFLEDWATLVKQYSDGVNIERVTEENEQYFDDAAYDLEQEFLTSLLEDYSIMLQKECEYLQSDEAIIETIEANEYEFTAEGNRF